MICNYCQFRIFNRSIPFTLKHLQHLIRLAERQLQEVGVVVVESEHDLAAVGVELDAPADAGVVFAGGRFVMPGAAGVAVGRMVEGGRGEFVGFGMIVFGRDEIAFEAVVFIEHEGGFSIYLDAVVRKGFYLADAVPVAAQRKANFFVGGMLFSAGVLFVGAVRGGGPVFFAGRFRGG